MMAGVVAPAHAAGQRPNILLIVADDMGYSDIGSFGGEIKTPNLDALAQRGLRARSFYVGPTCSPTRSMLLSGSDNHVAGLGNMAEYLGPKQKGKPGYEGHLNKRVASVASVLRDAGYHTYMAGKWHLGEEPGSWPAALGFERDFTLLQGGGSNWDDMKYPNPAHPRLTFTLDGKMLEKLPEHHFSSEAYANFIMKSVDENEDDGRPFFAYLSFQAVHSPFAAPDDWLDRYRGQYESGYDALRASRVARMKEMGIVGKDVQPFPRLPTVPAWTSLSREQQKLSARRMEIYAAMLSNMDHHIGRVLEHLEEAGKLDDTLVIFFSDNGAEPIELTSLVESVFSPEAKQWFLETFDQRPENWGKKGSAVDYGAAWAQVGSAPFRMFKATLPKAASVPRSSSQALASGMPATSTAPFSTSWTSPPRSTNWQAQSTRRTSRAARSPRCRADPSSRCSPAPPTRSAAKATGSAGSSSETAPSGRATGRS
jgi:arylsulfatase